MMTELQHILCKISEECAEVSQMAMKTQQYGLREKRLGQGEENIERLKEEFHDLCFHFARLESYTGEDFSTPPAGFAEEKLKKVEKYKRLSKQLGMVS